MVIINVGCTENPSGKDAQVTNTTAVNEKKPSYSVPFLSEDISWKSGLEQSLTLGGIIVAGLVILGGLAWLLAPIFGYRICTLLGNCEVPSITHSTGGNLQDPSHTNSFSDTYNTPYVSYAPGYRKRSLNYIGPILKTLASAYEKYELTSETKKN
ncbi:hypothetical protein PGB90_002093 [Kerria lacca]